MLRRSLFVSALMLASVVGFASSAKAVETATQDVTFPATVNATCNLTASATGSTQGELALPSGATDKKMLVTATPAMVGVDCTKGTLTVSTPELTTMPSGFAGILTNTAKVTSLSGKTATETAASPTLEDADKGDAMVEMTSTNTADFIPGQYVYTVTVTATL
ncbi:hypothetical protein OGM63_03115 [Plectonema radiosum NIES-515]|uniref:Spore coat protein U domain-containing protein n=1 Tax=Plectonema radiosum NIES-515 TaxID=2986073 RepID=A0ABT3ATT5_9CYAN|nr:hypothetical protein [Plectonema radiosum]MCV3212532.1 hypothetical protein [Plectonema radiosum NIES-515]